MSSSVLSGSGIRLLWIKLKGHKICQLPTLQPLKDLEMRISLVRPARLSIGPAHNNSLHQQQSPISLLGNSKGHREYLAGNRNVRKTEGMWEREVQRKERQVRPQVDLGVVLSSAACGRLTVSKWVRSQHLPKPRRSTVSHYSRPRSWCIR